MIYRIRHQTTYSYEGPVSVCQNLVRLAPRPAPRQQNRSGHLVINPEPAVISSFTDFFGNPASSFTIQEPHLELSVTSMQESEVGSFTLPEPRSSPAWEAVRDHMADVLEAYPFVFDSHYIQAGPELADYAAESFPPERPLLECVLDLTRRIHANFRYDPQATTVTSPLGQVLVQRAGVCQDFAHLEIGCLRSLGLAGRYVSGYLCTEPPPGQARLVGADASHAWASVWCPPFGWLDFDPTNNLVPSDKHITLAWGRDYDDVAPIKGVVLGGGDHRIAVAVDVVPVE